MSESPVTLNPDLEAALEYLGLTEMRRVAGVAFDRARNEHWTPQQLLEYLAKSELEHREAVDLQDRLDNAGLPSRKTLEEFDVTASSIPPETIEYLASLQWIKACENPVLVGPAGTGKTHLAVALGYRAIESGLRVRFFSAIDLVETMYRALADNSVGRTIEEILGADLIVIDEMGFIPLDDVGCQLLFRFIAAAYERRPVIVTSHWPFESWGRFLPERTTAVSLLDRLLHHSVIVVTDGDSYRLREARELERPWKSPNVDAQKDHRGIAE